MINYKKITPFKVTLADNRSLSAIGVGDIVLDCYINNTVRKQVVKEVYYTPGLGKTLLSMSCIANKGLKIEIGVGKCLIKSKDENDLAEATVKNGIYILEAKLNTYSERNIAVINEEL